MMAMVSISLLMSAVVAVMIVSCSYSAPIDFDSNSLHQPAICEQPPTWKLQTGENPMDVHRGNVTVVALLLASCQLCLWQASKLKELMHGFDGAGLTDVRAFVVNAGDLRSRKLRTVLERQIHGSSIGFLQDDDRAQIGKRLAGGKDDFYIYDRCGRLAYYVPFPLSFLSRPYVHAAILSTYFDEPCGPCPTMSSSEDGTNCTVGIINSTIADPVHQERNSSKTSSDHHRHRHHHGEEGPRHEIQDFTNGTSPNLTEMANSYRTDPENGSQFYNNTENVPIGLSEIQTGFDEDDSNTSQPVVGLSVSVNGTQENVTDLEPSHLDVVALNDSNRTENVTAMDLRKNQLVLNSTVNTTGDDWTVQEEKEQEPVINKTNRTETNREIYDRFPDYEMALDYALRHWLQPRPLRLPSTAIDKSSSPPIGTHRINEKI